MCSICKQDFGVKSNYTRHIRIYHKVSTEGVQTRAAVRRRRGSRRGQDIGPILPSLVRGTQEMTSNTGGTFLEPNALPYYDNPTLGLLHIGDQLSSVTPDQKHNFHEEVAQVLDPGVGSGETRWLPVGSPPAGTSNVGFQRPDERKRATTPDEDHTTWRAPSEGPHNSESREEIQVSTAAIRPKHQERIDCACFSIRECGGVLISTVLQVKDR